MSKPREFAALLVCIGVAFLFPPIALIFTKPGSVLGVPRPLFYMLVVWALLIIGAKYVTRKLAQASD